MLTPALMPGESIPEAEVLRYAGARIEKYRTGEVTLKLLAPSGQPLASGGRARVEQLRHKFLFGANLFRLFKIDSPESESAYEARFAELLNYATIPFYWKAYEPERGHPLYDQTERIVEWCRSHNIAIKGHPLAWNLADPAWLPSNVEEVRKLMLARVGDCAERFKDKIHFWDVTNEVAEFDRRSMEDGAPWQTEVIRKMGPVGYVQTAFHLARENSPDAVLLINDYVPVPKYLSILSKLTGNTRQPVFDAIGMQSHQHTGVWPATRIWNVADGLATMGRPVHFTETTILSGALQGPGGPPASNWNTTPQGEQSQAQDVERFYTIAFSNPAVEAISWWDFSDLGAWKGAPAGLLRRDMSPKPAYETLKRLIKEKWWTRTDVPVSGGEIHMRGFYGDYRVTLHDGGRELTGTFAFDKQTSRAIEVRLK